MVPDPIRLPPPAPGCAGFRPRQRTPRQHGAGWPPALGGHRAAEPTPCASAIFAAAPGPVGRPASQANSSAIQLCLKDGGISVRMTAVFHRSGGPGAWQKPRGGSTEVGASHRHSQPGRHARVPRRAPGSRGQRFGASPHPTCPATPPVRAAMMGVPPAHGLAAHRSARDRRCGPAGPCGRRDGPPRCGTPHKPPMGGFTS